MNILITSAHYHLSDKYGSETIWGVELINNYARMGYNVYAIAGVAELEKPLEEKVQLLKLGSTRSSNAIIEIVKKFIYPLFSFFLSWYLFIKLRGNLKLIHHIAPISPVSYDLFFLLGPWTKAKYILGPAMIPPDNSNPNDFGTVLGVKKSLSVRFLWIGYQITVPILRFLAIQTFKKSDNLITVTSEGKKYYDSFLNPQKVEVIPVGVSNYFNVENKKLKSNKTVTIVSASRLTERKGIDIILTAFYNVYKTHKNIRLKIVGTGEQYEELKELVKKLKLKNVVNFVGFVPNNEMVNHYKSADIFITATRHEPFGMSIIEAMCCGLPILSSNVNALKVIIGEGGIVVEKDNVIAFSENLEKLVVDLKLRKKLGLNASRLARENYIWDKIVKRYLKLAER